MFRPKKIRPKNFGPNFFRPKKFRLEIFRPNFFVGRSGGTEPFFSFQKICEGKFFEMVSWGRLGWLAPPESPLPVPCPPGGGLGGEAPLRNLCYQCLAPEGIWGGGAPLRNLRYPYLAPCTDGEKSKNEPQASYRPKNLTI